MNTDHLTDAQLVRLYEDYNKARRLAVKTLLRLRQQHSEIKAEMKRRIAAEAKQSG